MKTRTIRITRAEATKVRMRNYLRQMTNYVDKQKQGVSNNSFRLKELKVLVRADIARTEKIINHIWR